MLPGHEVLLPSMPSCKIHAWLRCVDLIQQAQLQSERFFGQPKLALDAVGGESAMRIADALEQVGNGGVV